MDFGAIAGLVWALGLLVLVAAILLSRRARRRGASFQAGVVGAMYEWQNKDKQQALQIIVDAKRRKRPGENADGTPDA